MEAHWFTTESDGIVHEGIAFTPSNENSRFGYQNMAEDHTCKGVGECHPYREFEGMQPSR